MQNEKIQKNSAEDVDVALLFWQAQQQLLRGRRRFEAFLAALVLCGLGALLAAQVWLYSDGNAATAATWFGAAYDAVPVATEQGLSGTVELELLDYSCLQEAFVLINGVRAVAFEQAVVRLQVFDGDVLELDASAYQRPVRVRLRKASAGIVRGLLQEESEVCGKIAEIGRVVFADAL